jgi:hypothetical protein
VQWASRQAREVQQWTASELIDGNIASRGGNPAERFHNFRVSARVLHNSTFNVRDMCNFK